MNKPRFQFLLNQQKKTIETANESKCLYLGIKQATNSLYRPSIYTKSKTFARANLLVPANMLVPACNRHGNFCVSNMRTPNQRAAILEENEEVVFFYYLD